MTQHKLQNEKFVFDALEVMALYQKSSGPKYLLEDLLPSKGLAGLVGSSDAGKSLFARNLAIAVASGEREYIGKKIFSRNRTGSTLYVSTEDNVEDTGELILKHLGLKSVHLDIPLRNLHFLFEPDDIHQRIKDHLEKHRCDLVVIDCFSDVFDDDLNSTVQVRQFLKRFKKLSDKHNCLILFVHHNNKKSAGYGPDKNNILGAQGFEGKMRIVLELKPDPTSYDVYHLAIVKGNRKSRAEKQQTYPILLNTNRLRFEYDCMTQITHKDYVWNVQTQKRPSAKDALMNDETFVNRAKELLFTENKSFSKAAEILQSEGYKIKKSALNELFPKSSGDRADTVKK